jgi:hypothetical protein
MRPLVLSEMSSYYWSAFILRSPYRRRALARHGMGVTIEEGDQMHRLRRESSLPWKIGIASGLLMLVAACESPDQMIIYGPALGVSPIQLELTVGEQGQFVADVIGVPNAQVTWRSGDDAVATVTQTGLVTGISVGETVVTAEVVGVRRQLTVSPQVFVRSAS